MKPTLSFSKNLEKILVGLPLFVMFVAFIISGDKDLKSGTTYPIVLGLEILLLIYFIAITKNWYGIFFIGYIILNIGFYLNIERHSNAHQLVLIGEFSQFALGGYFMFKTIKESIKNKDWEMYGTLIALELMFPFLYHYYPVGKEVYTIYYFALPFILGIIIFNDNLWDKYNTIEKKILLYILISALVEVLFISLRLI